ncbi:MAG: AAA family ATPase [archaeon]|nr:AAA family ATPase [archaeon]
MTQAFDDPRLKLEHRVGLVYVPGALPCFEEFGNLPTDLVGEDGLVEGRPASEILDMMIIPGGSLVESRSVKDDLAQEIMKTAEAGKFVLGICAGFQILAKSTDIGRLSPVPIMKQGLELLDVEFKPLICTDRVRAKVIGKSFLTDRVGIKVTGFHCHTYGKIVLNEGVKPILVSHVQRINYHRNLQNLISGVTNREGNVVGVLIHALLDDNPTIIRSITKSLGIVPEELQEIKKANSKLLEVIKGEVGVLTGIRPKSTKRQCKTLKLLLITSTGTGAGKTFITAGIAGALKKKGFRVGVMKIGADVRDLVPALYLIKEPMREYSSIKIGDRGWKPLSMSIDEASQNCDFILIEGVMGSLTGLLNDREERPYSTLEVALALNAPTIIISNCEREGIEGALVNLIGHISMMKFLKIDVKGVILNKAYMIDEVKTLARDVLESTNVKLLGLIPSSKFGARGMIPEVEIRYEEFGARAIEAVERYIDLNLLMKVARPPAKSSVNYKVLKERLREALMISRVS